MDMSCRKNEAPAMGLFLFHALFVKSSDLGDLGDLGSVSQIAIYIQ